MWWPELRVRAHADELMDDPANGGDLLAGALRELRVINALLGAAQPTVEGVARLWRRAGRPAQLTVIDIGAGTGDGARALLRWARRRGIQLQVILVDINPETCRAAAAYHRATPEVMVVAADMTQLPPACADIITAALVLHHLPSTRLATVVNALSLAARFGVVINDLHRHWLAWAAIRLATGLFSRNAMIRHDAPLSVRRGFVRSELVGLAQGLQTGVLRVSWRPLFRWLAVVDRVDQTAAVDRAAQREHKRFVCTT
jgi:2-polyprenyl-3-methyl-5-hydroxy-6-metoxy-1,4-benzoquinol methylase